MVGSLDKNNIRPISKEYIKNINNDNIEYIGEVEDIKKIWAMSHIAILLSRREGLPKSLLEAAASGRAIISTDVPGSREISRKSINAELVKFNDVNATAKAILYLAENHAVRKSYGLKSRELVEGDMSEEMSDVLDKSISQFKEGFIA